MQDLRPLAFSFLPIAEIRPEGWLRRQLRIQADGLSGHLDEFWPDIRDSRWIGGDREGWERVPYWLDGFLPLAYLLEDETMIARAKRYIDCILERQQADGWICPCRPEERGGYDLWAAFLILKVLTVYHDATGDERAVEAVERCLRQMDRHIDGSTLFGWAQTRWFECLIPIYWLYERRPAPWLLSLAVKLRAQGFDYAALYENWPYEAAVEKGHWSFMSHVVNQAMMLKGNALYYRLSGLATDRVAPARMLALLDRFHGMATGMFTGDECLSGDSPVQGSELCAVVELMYSMEQLLSVTGEAKWGDRLERLAFNALPAAFSPDMWTHQYDQQVNQVACTRQPVSIFNTNGGDANLFGLEPNYGCCTANLSQGWPKFARSLVMRSGRGLAVVAYAPCRVETAVDDVPVTLRVITDYPFRDTVRIEVETAAPVSFPLSLRIPAWAAETEVVWGGNRYPAVPGEFLQLEDCFEGCSAVELVFSMEARRTVRPRGLSAVVRGPLCFALPVPENWRQLPDDRPEWAFPHCDYEVLPAGDWAFALQRQAVMTMEEQAVGDRPFSPEGAPLVLRTRAYPIRWEMEKGCAAPLPVSLEPTGEAREVVLIPYGCTNLRLTELPVIE